MLCYVNVLLGSEMIYSRPVGSCGTKHGPDAPSRAKHIEGFREAVVINNSSVDREDPHQKYDVAPSKHHIEHLQRDKNKTNKKQR